MQANEGAMPSLNDVISSENNVSPNQVSYQKITTTQTYQPSGQTTNYSYSRRAEEQPGTTTKVTRKIVTSGEPETETTSYYSKKVTTTKTTTRGGQGPITQTNVTRYSNTNTTGGNRNQINSTNTYSRPGAQTTKTTTTTTSQYNKYGQNNPSSNTNTSSQMYRGNQRNVNPPKVIGNSQSYSGNRFQPKRPEASPSNKKARSPDPGSLRRKTINRGKPVENIQITHIIFTSRPTDFHMTEDLDLENLNKDPIQISKADHARLQKSGKVFTKCSCDGVEIAKPKKINLKGSTTIYQHARGIGMTNDRKENINPMFYSSEIKKMDPINTKKEMEKLENVETFRSSGKVYNSTTNIKKPSTSASKTSTYNRGSMNNNTSQNRNYNAGSTSNTYNRGGTTSNTYNRGGTTSSNTNTYNRGGANRSSSNAYNRGGMSNSIKTTTSTVYRGNNMGGGDGQIIKETNTKVQMGSRSQYNPTKTNTYTSTERKVYNQKNFFNK